MSLWLTEGYNTSLEFKNGGNPIDPCNVSAASDFVDMKRIIWQPVFQYTPTLRMFYTDGDLKHDPVIAHILGNGSQNWECSCFTSTNELETWWRQQQKPFRTLCQRRWSIHRESSGTSSVLRHCSDSLSLPSASSAPQSAAIYCNWV